MRYLHCPNCFELVDASLDVCPSCHSLMRVPRGDGQAPPEQAAEPGSEAAQGAGTNGARTSPD